MFTIVASTNAIALPSTATAITRPADLDRERAGALAPPAGADRTSIPAPFSLARGLAPTSMSARVPRVSVKNSGRDGSFPNPKLRYVQSSRRCLACAVSGDK
jgi:hypothetical protein